MGDMTMTADFQGRIWNPGSIGRSSLLQVRKNCGSKKGKVQRLRRARERMSNPSAEIPSGLDKSLSQALMHVTKP